MTDLAAEAGWPRATLDVDYNARASVELAQFEAALAAYRAGSERARALPGTRLNLVYDTRSGQALDLYGATSGGAPRPLFVFIHGGYWRALSKEDSAFMAPMLARHGIATAAVDYRLAPEASLTEIVREVRAAIAWLWHEAEALGIDRNRIYVGGSSAGGHLTGCVMASGWQEAFGLPDAPLAGALPVSGLFHLGPIAASFVQEWIALDAAGVSALSPLETISPASGCPAVVAWAAGEPAGFSRQSRAYAAGWQAAGHPTTLLEVPGRHHFDVILELAEEESPLGRALLGLVGAQPS
ncbi:alpha/beta hydrolase (plasmid) [Paroceanicella profunda]|uniref:Alpha/beta hydrolase n=1 Tax=Paroceanicella profunda TaxID=2579971 RepID=A0A5B8G3Y6_9RHOB|nr:alpha/beta hydrolase [Paroceanicella profunda]QDL94022.1 alpha/beta hydrolase [Paroceanicella profunda]